jgi:6-phosphogluconate dehydrogenase
MRYDFNFVDIAEVRRDSVVGSWLLDLQRQCWLRGPTCRILPAPSRIPEGRWTLMAAIEEGSPSGSPFRVSLHRFRSRQDHTLAEKVLSAMRYKFGGHVEPQAE